MKKTMKYFFKSFFVLIVFLFLINLIDSKLNENSNKLLNQFSETISEDEKKCEFILGMFVDENLDSKQEGKKVISAIKAIENIKPIRIDHVEVSNFFKDIITESPPKCSDYCKYDKEQVLKIKTDLQKAKIFLTRLKELLELKDFQCASPIALLKIQILSFYKLSKLQLVEYNIMSLVGEGKAALLGLEKMNGFFENSLLRDKYTIVQALIFLSILEQTRAMIVNHPGYVKGSIKFKKIKLEDIAERAKIGEIQGASTFINLPYEFDLFKTVNINEEKEEEQDKSRNQLMAKTINRVGEYFYLRNETVNLIEEALVSSFRDPCVYQNKIKCEPRNLNYFNLFRNPIGKIVANVFSNNVTGSFQKMRKRVDQVNSFLQITSHD